VGRPGSRGAWTRYGHGLRQAGRQNATAFGFSVMITATYGIVSGLEPSSPPFGYSFLFAAGGVVGLAMIMGLATRRGTG
jgi:hypothetical protein